jgi:multiple sugar transport system permease protein
MATVTAPAAVRPPRFLDPRLDNWPLAAVLAIALSTAAIAFLPPAASFWVALAAAALAALSAVYNAWGRYKGGLLVAPALALLFIMNIFPLLWSLGLSFFAYRANRARAPVFVGLDNYRDILADEAVWERLQTTAIIVVLTVAVQMVVGFLLALLFAKQFPLRRYLLILVLTPMMLSYVAVGAFFRYYYAFRAAKRSCRPGRAPSSPRRLTPRALQALQFRSWTSQSPGMCSQGAQPLGRFGPLRSHR